MKSTGVDDYFFSFGSSFISWSPTRVWRKKEKNAEGMKPVTGFVLSYEQTRYLMPS